VELGSRARYFREPVEGKMFIRGMVFNGFAKCLYPALKFDSDSERRFAILLEDDRDVVKWLKPPRDVLRIHCTDDDNYLPVFIVETGNGRFLCEIKRATEMDDTVVLQKAKAASEWCQRASTVSDKPWKYVMLAHDAILLNRKPLRSLYGTSLYGDKPLRGRSNPQNRLRWLLRLSPYSPYSPRIPPRVARLPWRGFSHDP
jgi:hypothetical protein